MSPTSGQEPYETIIYRLTQLEATVKQLQEQFRLYVPMRENELQLNAIRSIVERMEREMIDLKGQIKSLDDKVEQQGTDSLKRDTEQSDGLNKLQLRALQGFVTIVITIMSGILVAYITHLIH